MRKLLAVFVAATMLMTLLAASASAGPTAPVPAEVHPDVIALLEALGPGEMATVVVTLHDQADLKGDLGAKKADRTKEVVRRLKDKATKSQKAIAKVLRARRRAGTVSSFTSFWVLNAVSVTATADVINELAARTDVATITPDEISIIPTAGPPEPNLTAVNAPALWDIGLTGQGIVVASLDTGVDVNHPDLVASWRGGSNSWFDPYGQFPTIPTDLIGHGTGTMGVMVGRDAGGTSIGIAPDAQWIAARIFNNNGRAKTSKIHAAFQWILDPDGDPNTDDAPDVVNNSWSTSSGGSCNLTFQLDLQALRAAGIVPVFAAGNFGPGSSTSVSPANNPEALAVGAVDGNNQPYALSSTGPSACGEASTLYPEIVAPGVNIRTAERYGMYQVTSGTSLAAPHVAGVLALLLSFNPDLTTAEQEAALMFTAVDLGAAGPDNQFGYGLVDAMAAYQSVQDGTQGTTTTTAPPPTTTTTAPPPSDVTGPVTESPTLDPNPSNGTADVVMHATGNDSGTGGSNIAAAEYFVGAVGADGSGTALTIGSLTPVASLDGTIPAAVVGALSAGTHIVSVHSQDAEGNWGLPVTIGLDVDKSAPIVNGVSASPSPTAGAAGVTLSATADDAGSAVSAAEWFTGGDPGVGNGTPMTRSGTGPWSLSASIDVSGWANGDYFLNVRAQDGVGNWSAPVGATLTVDAPLSQFPVVYFSTSGNTVLPNVSGTADNADIYTWDDVVYGTLFDAAGSGSAGLPGGANVDAYARVDDTDFYLSFAASNTSVPGIGNVQDEDVVHYNGGVWSVFFDGTAKGLTTNGHDVDAIDVVGGVLYFSTSGNKSIPGVGGSKDDADIYSWDGTSFDRVWDASAAGLPGAADVDGLAMVDATHFYLSFKSTNTTVPTLGSVADVNVVYNDAGTWSVFFDGTANGLTAGSGHDLDAIEIP